MKNNIAQISYSTYMIYIKGHSDTLYLILKHAELINFFSIILHGQNHKIIHTYKHADTDIYTHL